MERYAKFSRQRRTFLQRVGSVALPLAATLSADGGCSPVPGSAASSGPIRVALSELPPGTRLRVLHGDLPVEIRRTGIGIAGRSLLCPHFGCEVYWVETARVYRCPCHEGSFDPEGRPIAGPPASPLEEIHVTIDGESVVVGA